MPETAKLLAGWPPLERLGPSALFPLSLPVFHLPLWLSSPQAFADDRQFYADLAYASLNGYLFVRLIDDVADGDNPPALAKLLPVTAFFHSRFQATLTRYFAFEHPFWEHYWAAWDVQADNSVADAHLSSIDLADFLCISARKTSAARIPLAAAAFRLGAPELIGRWTPFVAALAAVQQFSNDYFGVEKDHRFGIRTYLLTTYEMQARAGETLGEWLAREGLGWGREVLLGLFRQAADESERLANPELTQWLAERDALLHRRLAMTVLTRRVLDSLVGDGDPIGDK